MTRSFRGTDWKAFNERTSAPDWSFIYTTDVDTGLIQFNDKSLFLHNAASTTRKMVVRGRHVPWLTATKFQTMRKRNTPKRHLQKTFSKENESRYSNLKQEVQRLIAESKQQYFHHILSNERDPKKLWKHMTSLSDRNHKAAASSITPDIDGKRTSDASTIFRKLAKVLTIDNSTEYDRQSEQYIVNRGRVHCCRHTKCFQVPKTEEQRRAKRHEPLHL